MKPSLKVWATDREALQINNLIPNWEGALRFELRYFPQNSNHYRIHFFGDLRHAQGCMRLVKLGVGIEP